ncbi:MAG: hydroxymethylbilane synthase [Zetaproteobacteria bacterium]|nr:MAG: hydroxymethylbilane synthase [Zetaproteobacteria bacterium]
MAHLKIATRGSALALWQAEHVAAELERLHEGVTTELIRIKTTGDKILDVPLAKVGGKGLFTKEIEEALLDGRADLAVHSMKDVPAELPEKLAIRAILERADPRDAVATVTGGAFSTLPTNAKIGTSSLRRVCQIKAKYPGFEFVAIRGNVQTRLNKLGKEADAVVLAAAGVKRLDIDDQMHFFLETDEMLPAVAQGAIGIETRAGDERVNLLTEVLNHPDTAVCVAAERAFLARLEGGCQVPIAGHATLEGDTLHMEGLVGEVDGSQLIRRSLSGSRTEATLLGTALADEVLDAGGREILARLYAEND